MIQRLVAAKQRRKSKLPVAGLWFPLQEDVVEDDTAGVPPDMQWVQQGDIIPLQHNVFSGFAVIDCAQIVFFIYLSV